MLKIAIQKSGRLSESTLRLLKDTGLKVDLGKKQLIAPTTNFPGQILFLRDDDIPKYVEDGVADIGIVGENELREKHADVILAKKLGFSKCRLSLAIPREDEYTGIDFFEGKSIATSYTHILKNFLNDKNINASIHEISGSVEIAPNIGLTDAIFDIVSSGSTLFQNGLKEVELVMQSEAVLIQNKLLDDTKLKLLNKLMFRIEAVKKAEDFRYILLNAPTKNLEQIVSVIPGMKSPTVLPLHDPEWSSVHSVVEEKHFWDAIEQLKELGAQGILLVPIEKMIL